MRSWDYQTHALLDEIRPVGVPRDFPLATFGRHSCYITIMEPQFFPATISEIHLNKFEINYMGHPPIILRSNASIIGGLSIFND